MRTAQSLLPALGAIALCLALPAFGQLVPTPKTADPASAIPVPTGSPATKAPTPAAVNKEAAAAVAPPQGNVPTFTYTPKAAGGSAAAGAPGGGAALKLPDPNAPLTSPVSTAAKVVPTPAQPTIFPAPGTAPTPGARPGSPPQGTTTTASSLAPPPGGGVIMVPNTGGAQTRTADGVVTVTGNVTGDSGLPANPNYPPTPPVSELPGLGKMPGTQAPGKPLVVRSVAGVNDIVPISRNFPNRIATPFRDPVWVDQGTANIDKLHGSIFVTPKNDRAIQLFITENNDPNAAVVQMTLLPRSIPGQTVVLQIEGFESAGAKSAASERERESRLPDEYTDQMLFLLREVARGRAPSGYTEESITAPVANLPGGVQVLPEKRYSGATFDIYRYRLRNSGQQRVTLTEQSFYQKGVRAVSFFPLLQLGTGQETAVHIVTSKDGE